MLLHGSDEVVRIIPVAGDDDPCSRDAAVGVGLGPYAYGDFVVGEVAVGDIEGYEALTDDLATVERDSGNLDVSFDLVDGVLLGLVLFHVADHLDGLPQKRPGNPQIGHFDDQSGTWAIADETTAYDFPVEDVGDGDLAIAAHAEVWIVDDSNVTDLRE